MMSNPSLTSTLEGNSSGYREDPSDEDTPEEYERSTAGVVEAKVS